MSELLHISIVVLISIPVGIIAGNGAVYFFNNIPAIWLCDYGEEPNEELKSKETQRIKSYPWKYVLTATFIVIGIYLGMKDWQFAVASILAIWISLEIAIADKKYMIIPDQLVLLLAIVSFGFIPFHNSHWDMIWGVLIGAGSMLVLSLFGRLVFKKDILGFGDVKLSAALGLLLGWQGLGLVLIGASFLAGIVGAIGLISKKLKKDDEIPFGPYLLGATIIYILFFMYYGK